MNYSLSTILFTLTLATAVHAENWPQWRGPTFNGATDEKGLPANFSKTESVKWSIALPGPSAATPAIWGDRVFVSSVDTQAGTLVALCLDRKTGRELWRREVGVGLKQDDRSNFASPSPVTDGQGVWFFYGNGDLACFTVDGAKQWSRNLQTDHGKFAFLWTFSSSPLLHEGRLILQILQRDTPVNRANPLGAVATDKPAESFLLALDPATGKQLWKSARPSDAKVESREAFSTPVPFAHNGRNELLVTGGDCISGHDPVTGKELWRSASWNEQKITHWRLVPSPVAGDDVVLACAPKNEPIFAFKGGSSGKIEIANSAWRSEPRGKESATLDLTSDVPTPLFYQGKFYVVNGGKKKLLCVEPKTGKVLWSGDLGGKAVFEASPTAADGKIYVMNHKGEVFVAAAGGDSFKLLHTAAMGDDTDKDLRSCVAISQGSLFIRTGAKLYCVGK